ncbi:hypothetical protein BB561_000320 [Smittium simulii]|uniref:Uncharacterized protein n=1 Tax=Smittium simulii TaxID=133385 RepID=A0A2T9YZL0_9FUNG|nr:hypothetical protein BB561_000320 [Smittium simulii]
MKSKNVTNKNVKLVTKALECLVRSAKCLSKNDKTEKGVGKRNHDEKSPALWLSANGINNVWEQDMNKWWEKRNLPEGRMKPRKVGTRIQVITPNEVRLSNLVIINYIRPCEEV